MMSIQKKSLQHVSKTLGAVDSYEVYRAIQKALTENQVSKEVDKAVMDAFQKSFNAQFDKVKEAKEWVDVLLSDPS